MRGIVYVATGRPLPVGAAVYTSTLPQALLVGFGILAPHIANKHLQVKDRSINYLLDRSRSLFP